jgi:hypothetical protein
MAERQTQTIPTESVKMPTATSTVDEEIKAPKAPQKPTFPTDDKNAFVKPPSKSDRRAETAPTLGRQGKIFDKLGALFDRLRRDKQAFEKKVREDMETFMREKNREYMAGLASAKKEASDTIAWCRKRVKEIEEEAARKIEDNNKLNDLVERQYEQHIATCRMALEQAKKREQDLIAIAERAAGNWYDKITGGKRKVEDILLTKLERKELDGGQEVEETTVEQEGEIDEDMAKTVGHLNKLQKLDGLMEEMAALASIFATLRNDLDAEIKAKGTSQALAAMSMALYHPLRDIGERIAQLRESHVRNHPKPSPGVCRYAWDAVAGFETMRVEVKNGVPGEMKTEKK